MASPPLPARITSSRYISAFALSQLHSAHSIPPNAFRSGGKSGGKGRGVRSTRPIGGAICFSGYFFPVSGSLAVQEINIVYALAALAISAVFSSFAASIVLYGTTLLSRKSRSAPGLIAKLIFSGILPVAVANFSAFFGNDAHNMATDVEQRASAVSGLNGRTDLKKSSIIQKPTQ